MKNVLRIIGIVLISIAFSFTNNPKKVVIIDVGHGGEDKGAVVEKITEKKVVLSIAEKIKKLSENSNVQIILTRNSDQYISLSERTKEINQAKVDAVISLHINKSPNKEKKGKEIYIYEKTSQYQASKNLAERLASSFGENTEIKSKNLHLLRNVKHPIALIELGYLSNEEEKKSLLDEHEQTEIAKQILESFQ